MLKNGSVLPARLTQFLKSHNLYKEGDYLTIACYSLNLSETGGKNFNTFVTIPHDSNGKDILWRSEDANQPFAGLGKSWESITRDQHIKKQPSGAARGSLNSMHLYYTPDAVASPDSLGANRLTILTVSDDLHQGNDNIAGDLRILNGVVGCHLTQSSMNSLEKQANERSEFVKRKFALLTQNKSLILDNTLSLPYQISQTEVKPIQAPIIQNVLGIPAIPEPKRVRGGYRIKIKAPEEEGDYAVEQMELVVNNGENKKMAAKSGKGKDISLTVPRSMISSGKANGTLRLWVRYKDGLYNCLVLSPFDEDNKGLTMSHAINTPTEPKIYGFMGVNDALWFPFLPESYEYTVMIYAALFTVLVVAILAMITMYLVKKYSTYTPASEKLSFRPVSKSVTKKNSSK